jgi:hypothetical protein
MTLKLKQNYAQEKSREQTSEKFEYGDREKDYSK